MAQALADDAVERQVVVRVPRSDAPSARKSMDESETGSVGRGLLMMASAAIAGFALGK